MLRLTAEGIRVLGCLIEKELATPQGYPLSLNALRNACNQTTGRDPVVDFSDVDVQDGLDDLRAHKLTRTVYARGSRTPKYDHLLDEFYDLTPDQVAVLGVLLLRGPQTVGELRQRTDRMHAFEDLDAVEATMAGLARHRLEPLVERLPREPGQKQERWRHLLGAEAVPTADAAATVAPSADATAATLEAGTFDPADFAAELARADDNHEIATTLLLENDRVRIWDLTLDPGQRAPFHCHAVPYLFVCVAPGRAISRFPSGHQVTIDYEAGATWFTDLEHGPEVHDLENVGATTLRFTTVELKA